VAVDLRASDEDRERVVQMLQRHTAAGRLSLDEFTDRVDVVHCARTLGELAVVTRDLPAEPAHDAAAAEAQAGARGRHELMLVFLVAIVALLVLGLAVAASR
jgi:hypothetical protein